MDHIQRKTDSNPVADEESLSTVSKLEGDLEWKRFIQNELGKLENQEKDEGKEDSEKTSSAEKNLNFSSLIEKLPLEQLIDSAIRFINKKTEPEKKNRKEEKGQRGTEEKNRKEEKGQRGTEEKNRKEEKGQRGDEEKNRKEEKGQRGPEKKNRKEPKGKKAPKKRTGKKRKAKEAPKKKRGVSSSSNERPIRHIKSKYE
jgi:hypothetical protein